VTQEATAPVRRPGRPRDPDVDERILESATRLILERGVDAMTVDEVAVRARVGKATVYRRWSHKIDLAGNALDRLYASIAPLSDTGDLVEDVTRLHTSLLEFANTPEGRLFLRTSAAESVRDPRIARVHREARGRFETSMAVIFERARTRSEIPATAPIAWACQYIGSFLVSPVVSGRPTPAVAKAAEVTGLLLHGLNGP
jgi:AcrR family transcriptional regulator